LVAATAVTGAAAAAVVGSEKGVAEFALDACR